MDLFSELPIELYGIILSYVHIKDLINLSMSSNHFNNQIGKSLDEYVYGTINKNNTLDNHPQKDNMFVTYFRGKSYGGTKKGIDVGFTLRDEELIIYHSWVNIIGHGPYLIIITINRHFMYTVYEFYKEVDQDGEYTPDYYGWDWSDTNVYVLKYKCVFNHINEIKLNELTYCEWYDYSEIENHCTPENYLNQKIYQSIISNNYNPHNCVKI